MSLSLDNVTKNLTWKELACKDKTGYPNAYVKDGRVYRLAQVFENIRKLCRDKPIIIHSAYRTPEWNRKVGGVSNSQHVLGIALDLHHTTMDNKTFTSMIIENWEALGVRGVGQYKNFVHIDIRDSEQLVVWSGREDT